MKTNTHYKFYFYSLNEKTRGTVWVEVEEGMRGINGNGKKHNTIINKIE